MSQEMNSFALVEINNVLDNQSESQPIYATLHAVAHDIGIDYPPDQSLNECLQAIASELARHDYRSDPDSILDFLTHPQFTRHFSNYLDLNREQIDHFQEVHSLLVERTEAIVNQQQFVMSNQPRFEPDF